MELQEETTLAKVRLHWGIFIPALLLTLGLICATVPFILFAQALRNDFKQIAATFSQPVVSPLLTGAWLIPVGLEFVIVCGLFLATLFAYLKSEVTLTNRRLVFRTGFLSRRSGELPLENVESIYMSEPLLGRMCGYGTVMVTTVGGVGFPLRFIGSPQNFHSALQTAVLNVKRSGRRTPKLPEIPAPSEYDDSRYKPKG